MSDIPCCSVTLTELRHLFNSNQYWEKLKAGEFYKQKLFDAHARKNRPSIPKCTRSQILAYKNEKGEKIAVVHQYLKRDGNLGGSGRPDPKQLFHEGKLYIAIDEN